MTSRRCRGNHRVDAPLYIKQREPAGAQKKNSCQFILTVPLFNVARRPRPAPQFKRTMSKPVAPKCVPRGHRGCCPPCDMLLSSTMPGCPSGKPIVSRRRPMSNADTLLKPYFNSSLRFMPPVMSSRASFKSRAASAVSRASSTPPLAAFFTSPCVTPLKRTLSSSSSSSAGHQS
jgi:hypothetical protein